MKWKQIRFRIQYWLQDKLFPHPAEGKVRSEKIPASRQLVLVDSVPAYRSFQPPATFQFLNLRHRFDGAIDWNFGDHGKLWTYNLNYFEFLAQDDLSPAAGLDLIRDFIARENRIADGMEPFPTSLRIIFWIRFLSRHQVQDKQIDRSLYRQWRRLGQRLEYHLMGNHLLENAFALLFGAVYFSEVKAFRRAAHLLRQEMEEQILADGAHFELSPMYHQLIGYRLLDTINLLSHNSLAESDKLLSYLREQAGRMLSWLRLMIFANGDLPRLNDSTPGIAPTPSALLDYATRLGIEMIPLEAGASGYRKFNTACFELLIDAGSIGPDYIPGHAHSDTFNFLLYYRYAPLIVDTGISTYEKNARRTYERSTAAHNTVMVDGREQSEVWGGFRVAQRARITSLSVSDEHLVATHDGYRNIGVVHERSFFWESDQVQIHDRLSGSFTATAFLHFHPNVRLQLHDELVRGDFGTIQFAPSPIQLSIQSYDYALGFNQLLEAKRLVIEFKHELKTKIQLL